MLRRISLLATGLLTAGALAACGASSSGSNAAAGGLPTQSVGGAAGGFAGHFPGTSGQIAAVSGSTLQVQNQTDGQVAVSFTDKTTITAQVSATAAALKVGDCVSVTPVVSNGSATSATSLTAATVRITPSTDGACAAGFGGGFPGRSGGGFGARAGAPSGAPGTAPSGAPAGGRAGFGGANGQVTAVTAGGFTVKETRPDFGSSGSSGSASPATTVSVAVDHATTYTTTKAASASVLKVGACITASGTTGSTGAVAATRISISEPVGGQCDAFGGFGHPGTGSGAQSGAAA